MAFVTAVHCTVLEVGKAESWALSHACGSHRAGVHTVHVPWRHSACLKGMSMGVIMETRYLGSSFILFASGLGADCSNEKVL